MRSLPAVAAALALASCSRTPPPASAPVETPAPRITQFYSTTPRLARGETGMLCYGVENAKTVWLSPPHRELSAALSRCVEVAPTATTTYTLNAEGAGGSVKQEFTITLGPPKVKIVEVWVNSQELTAGQQLQLCYKVQNAVSVRVEPEIAKLTGKPNCGTATPKGTATYTVTATGAGGEQDTEHVTVRVH